MIVDINGYELDTGDMKVRVDTKYYGGVRVDDHREANESHDGHGNRHRHTAAKHHHQGYAPDNAYLFRRHGFINSLSGCTI